MRPCLFLAWNCSFAYAFSALPIDQRSTGGGCTVSNKCDHVSTVTDKTIGLDRKDPTHYQILSKSRSNCGVAFNCRKFDAKTQDRSTTGKHAFQAPGDGDIRGPCPGLNAAANHGYLPRNGIISFEASVEGLVQLYGLGRDLSAFLTYFAVLATGDQASMKYSIGFLHSHNKIEGDSSLARCDAYLNNGDANSLSIRRYMSTYIYGARDDRFTLDDFAQSFAKNIFRSIKDNPFYFNPLLATTVIAAGMYNFAIVFMSNHSAEEPAGYLDGQILNSFFSVRGKYPNMYWKPGHERIPEEWFARSLNEPYGNVNGFIDDLVAGYFAYPQSFKFGGNMHGKDSFVPIDVADISGGVYTTDTLFFGNNLACLFYEFEKAFLPKSPWPPSATPPSNCPKAHFYTGSFPSYPGSEYSPSGGPTNCSSFST